MRRPLDLHIESTRVSRLVRVEVHALVIIAGALILLLASLYGGSEPVNGRVPGPSPFTALGLIGLSLACLLTLRGGAAANAAAACLSALAMVVMAWLAVAPTDPMTIWRAPPPPACVSQFAGATAMLLIAIRPKVSGVIGLMAAFGLAYPVFRLCLLPFSLGVSNEILGRLQATPISSAVLVAWCILVCILLHPRLPFGAVFLESSLRGRLLRRGLPVVSLVPILAAAAGFMTPRVFPGHGDQLVAIAASVAALVSAAGFWRLARLVDTWQSEAIEDAARLSRANEALQRFANTAAHDLKAPMRHVLVYSELLADALERGDVEAAKRFSTRIGESAVDLPRQVTAMLAFARSSFKSVNRTDCYLSELVRSAAAMQEADIKAASAKIILDNDAYLKCDSSLIATVLQNLMANSVKYRSGATPVIHIDVLREPLGWRVSVEDNGPGFESGFAQIAFDPLTRGRPETSTGTGMGLVTCRTIVEAHGGSIRIVPAAGARVEFTLPFELPAERSSAPAAFRARPPFGETLAR